MKISNEVLAVLSTATTAGPFLKLPGKLDRNLYASVNKVLEANGGKWSRKEQAHVFDESAADAIEQALMTGEFQRVKQDFGQFDTPASVGARVIELAQIEPGMSVLEPSAGIGNLAVPAIEAGGIVHTFEIDAKRSAALTMRIARLESKAAARSTGQFGDFLDAVPTQEFDRVLMNPPFAKQADIAHVMHARLFLKPGGRLVAVMSASVTYRSDAKTKAFHDFMDGNGGTIEHLPDGAFKESGTAVKAVIASVSF